MRRVTPSVVLLVALMILMGVLTTYSQQPQPRRRIGVGVQPAVLVKSVPRRARTMVQPNDLILRVNGLEFVGIDEFALAAVGEVVLDLDRLEVDNKGKLRLQLKKFSTKVPARLVGEFVLIVTSVESGSPAEAADIQANSLITGVNGTPISSVEDFTIKVQVEEAVLEAIPDVRQPAMRYTYKIKPQRSEQ